MRRIAPAGLVPVLLTGLVGMGPAAASVDPAPGRAPRDLPTAGQLSKGLLAVADLPSGYTGSAMVAEDTTAVPGSGLCREGVLDRSAPMPQVYRTFRHADGSMIAASITTTGSRRARAIVDATATAPTRCPIVDGNVTTKWYSPLPLPGLAADAAGLDEWFQDYVGERTRSYHVVVARGDVTAIFVEMRGTAQNKSRFLTIVKAASRKLRRIA
jgi:hypothetical protein